MKKIKHVLSLFLVVCMLLTVASVTALAAEYTIKGDGIILAAYDSAVKVNYSLLADSVATSATWSIESEDAALPTYAAVDSETGDLYVSKNALGKSFKIIASVDGAEVAEKEVSVANKYYYENFDNETLDSTTLTSSLFSQVSNAKVISRENGFAVQYTGATELYNNDIITNNIFPLVVTMPEGFAPEYLTIESKAKIDATVDTVGNTATIVSKGRAFSALCYNGAWRSINTYIATAKNATQATYGYKAAYTSNPTNTGTRDADFSYNNWVPVVLKVTNKATAATPCLGLNMTVNGVSALGHNAFSYTSTSDKTMHYELSTISFGSDVDDIEIYSGEKVSYSFTTGLKIVGDDKIVRAPEGITANINYSLEADVTGVTVPENNSWSIEPAYNGVSVSNEGVVSVSGSSELGDFTVCAKDNNGNLLASKTVKITQTSNATRLNNSSSCKVTPDKTRLYLDFEGNQTVGSSLTTNPGDTNRDFSALRIYTSDKGEGYPLAKADSTGNIYASAEGYINNTSIGVNGANLTISVNTDDSYFKPADADYLTFGGKFRIESSTLENNAETTTQNGDRGSLICFGSKLNNSSNTTITVDIWFEQVADGVAAIYNGMDGNGEGNKNIRNTVALKEMDEWFEARVEFDVNSSTFDLYIDDVLVIDNEKTLEQTFKAIYLGCGVDDITMYSGREAVATAQAGDTFNAFADGIKVADGATTYTWSAADGDGETSSASVMLMSDTDYSDTIVLVAIYSNDGKLLDVAKADVVKSAAGLSLAAVEANAKIPANAYLKVFHWDIDTLVPVVR